jgi:lincosamide nucleotidyltransferase
VLPQEALIARVRALCTADSRLDAALMYGSFAQGSADEHSDIEFWLFFGTGPGDPRAWIAQVAPLTHLVRNEFGAHVAIFRGLIRGEFHFASVADIGSVRGWPARGGAVPVVDRRGELAAALHDLPDRPATGDAEELCGRFANWLLLAHHVGLRGEHLRALDALAHAQRHLLRMARLAENSTEHWLTPSRRAEQELRPETTAALAHTHQDVRLAWRSGRALWTELAARSGKAVPQELFDELEAAIRQRPTGGSPWAARPIPPG